MTFERAKNVLLHENHTSILEERESALQFIIEYSFRQGFKTAENVIDDNSKLINKI